MQQPDQPIVADHGSDEGSLGMYVHGFILSVGLTVIAYLSVVRHLMSGSVLIGFIIGLALIQFLVQMFFFLHLGKETKPRWKLAVAGFMVMVVLILVGGSLWIMNNLNYRMMTPQQINNYMQSQDGDL
jgi:cytochrome o ubiquinol oxidase subunit IV